MALSADIIRLHFLLPIDTADARLFALAYADGNLKHSVVWWILFIFLALLMSDAIARPLVAVTVPAQAWLVKQIADDKVALYKLI